MKKSLLVIGVILLLAITWSVIYTRPMEVSRTLDGLEYRTGTGHNNVTPVKVNVNGSLRKSITGLTTFRGIIRVTGATQPNPDNSRQLTIDFDRDGYAVMTYGYYVQGTPIVHSYGVIFINHDFSKVTILENKTGWIAANGLTISAPATDRNQAVNMSNQLMKTWLKGYVLR